jgi:hypothetical protein
MQSNYTIKPSHIPNVYYICQASSNNARSIYAEQVAKVQRTNNQITADFSIAKYFFPEQVPQALEILLKSITENKNQALKQLEILIPLRLDSSAILTFFRTNNLSYTKKFEKNGIFYSINTSKLNIKENILVTTAAVTKKPDEITLLPVIATKTKDPILNYPSSLKINYNNFALLFFLLSILLFSILITIIACSPFSASISIFLEITLSLSSIFFCTKSGQLFFNKFNPSEKKTGDEVLIACNWQHFSPLVTHVLQKIAEPFSATTPLNQPSTHQIASIAGIKLNV